MFALKPLSHDSVSGALAKAERYRLLNEPAEAASICHDILEIEPENQQALIMLVLALSDQISEDPQAFAGALNTASRLQSTYDRAYYAGIVWERRAKARYQDGGRSLPAHRLRLDGQSPPAVRTGRASASSRQRRLDPQMEHVRAVSGPPSGANRALRRSQRAHPFPNKRGRVRPNETLATGATPNLNAPKTRPDSPRRRDRDAGCHRGRCHPRP